MSKSYSLEKVKKNFIQIRLISKPVIDIFYSNLENNTKMMTDCNGDIKIQSSENHAEDNNGPQKTYIKQEDSEVEAIYLTDLTGKYILHIVLHLNQ